jgi:uncharacterized protein
VLVWPFLWGLTEQLTYNGYLVPRFQVLCRSTSVAVAIVAFSWSFQHVVMPFTYIRSTWFSGCCRRYRTRSSRPSSTCAFRRVIPFAIVHAVLDGASVLIGVLMPRLRA